ncbi:hypothetical protein LIER_20539 [Lithospermum erythrorhizon]|uniref:Uncharacterized protein n=1 Tax=Lithospermum erythrorhizon TaxID=34254 RepID=A0AAV3QMR1_LITER
MMTRVMTLEEQIAALTKVIEDLAKQVQRQDDSLSHLTGKVVDHEYQTQAAEASLRELSPTEASTPSKATRKTLQTSPPQASSMPQRTFEQLLTRAHDMELTIPEKKGEGLTAPVAAPSRAKYEVKRP